LLDHSTLRQVSGTFARRPNCKPASAGGRAPSRRTQMIGSKRLEIPRGEGSRWAGLVDCLVGR
jgi:hypothetical protein